MAQWKETLEPYIKVQERIKTTTIVPTTGEDLLVGAVIVSDAGPCTPTIISSQSEFLKTYSSVSDIDESYLRGLNGLYGTGNTDIPKTMWENAYRLSGSTKLLCVRANKGDNVFAFKEIKNGAEFSIIKDGEVLPKRASFRLVMNYQLYSNGTYLSWDSFGSSTGWNIAINNIGVYGNRTTTERVEYDYFCDNIPDLVDQLNSTAYFLSTDYEFYNEGGNKIIVSSDDSIETKRSVKSVIFKDVYYYGNLIDTNNDFTWMEKVLYYESTTPSSTDDCIYKSGTTPFDSLDDVKNYLKANIDTNLDGKLFCYTESPESTTTRKYLRYMRKNIGMQFIIATNIGDPVSVTDNNGDMYSITSTPDTSGGSTQGYKIITLNTATTDNINAMAINVSNSTSPLKLRIRRFNHNAVMSRSISEIEQNNCTSSGKSPWSVLTNVLDAYTNDNNNGSGTGPSESVRKYDFYEFAILDSSISDEVSLFNVGNITSLGDITVDELNKSLNQFQLSLPDDLADLNINYYGYTSNTSAGSTSSSTTPPPSEIVLTLNLDKTNTLLKVNNTDLKRALDLITLDEAYVVEGLSDLGNTEVNFQNYIANIAINDNYFYPISTANSTNYMVVRNSATKISQESEKLYYSSPWDVDTGTFGWRTNISPSVLYWETVARNTRNNNEFAPTLGETNGIGTYQSPIVEFNKKSRQLLLSAKVNTIKWDSQINNYIYNNNITKTSTDNILNDDGNSRLNIRISKTVPVLLRQFIGKRITATLCEDVKRVIRSYFESEIYTMNYNIDGYRISCNYDDTLARQGKIKVVVSVRYSRALRYIEVYNDAYDVGIDFSDN